MERESPRFDGAGKAREKVGTPGSEGKMPPAPGTPCKPPGFPGPSGQRERTGKVGPTPENECH